LDARRRRANKENAASPALGEIARQIVVLDGEEQIEHGRCYRVK